MNDSSRNSQQASEPLKLERPLAVIDTESTGLDPETAHIVRISVLIVQPDGSHSHRSELVNPGVPIPPGATAVHGITDQDVMNHPPFRAYAHGLADALEDCDLAGFAIERFHLPLLVAEFRRAGVAFSTEGRAVIDIMSIYHRLEPRDFDTAYHTYVGEDSVPDRASGQRASAALRILNGQLDSEPSLPRDPRALARWANGVPDTSADEGGRFTYLESGDVAFNFGKHKGETLASVAQVDSDYVAWVASNQSFGADARELASKALREVWGDE